MPDFIFCRNCRGSAPFDKSKTICRICEKEQGYSKVKIEKFADNELVCLTCNK